MKELEKTYNPADIEDRLYQKWLDGKYFHAEVNRSKKPFTIVMPPPNITGQLHMGHALDNTMQDILIRYKRMQGYEALWQPGTDHAAIATEVKVIDKLKKKGVDKADLGRDGFLKECWKWRDEYGTRIVNQLHKLGSSADWDRERFTMDHGCSDAVLEVFVKLYEKGYIYKGSRIINWCPVCQTSISDAEVEHVEQNGFFWHINYPVVGEPGRFVEIATTRPETMLGDTAVAVNPEDERYQDIVGKMLKLPLTDREIPVIADPYVDKEFGTGCVKITPAHDPNDFEVGKRHNLEEIIILNDDATVNVPGPYFGMDRYEARKAIVADLEAQGLLVKVVPHSHNVGTHDRCKTTVEPMVKQQWFVKMEEMAKPAIEALKNGSLTFVPESFGKTYLHWLEGIRDWCISRQLWWGHRIPAYYCQECGEIVVSKEAPHACPKCGCTSLKQDEDTLDTWFSSALWPFSTLGWPEKTEDLDYFYPTDVLVTGYDIIFFWVARMAFQTRYCMKSRPFKDVLIHGLVRDSQGRKMSKSLGNGVDPMDVIAKSGVDSLRFFLTTNSTPGQDLRYSEEKVEASANFINKIWNAARFVLMHTKEDMCMSDVDLTHASMIDKWILRRFNEVLENVTANMEKYEYALVGNELYSFVWDDFCSWYIELSKAGLFSDDETTRHASVSTLVTVLSGILRMLHPFMPFVTEEIYLAIPHDYESINLEVWPSKVEVEMSDAEMTSIRQLLTMIEAVRGIKADYQLKPSFEIDVIIKDDKGKIVEGNVAIQAILAKMCHATWVSMDSDEEMLTRTILNGTLSVPLASIVNVEEEIEKLTKELERLRKEIARGEGMLSNEKFVSKAPQAKVEAEKEKLEAYKAQYALSEKQLEVYKNKK